MCVRFLAPRAGFEPARRSKLISSVARVTAVHTIGRLPQAADRAILPLRIHDSGWGASPVIVLGNRATEKLASLNLPQHGPETDTELPSRYNNGFDTG